MYQECSAIEINSLLKWTFEYSRETPTKTFSFLMYRFFQKITDVLNEQVFNGQQ